LKEALIVAQPAPWAMTGAVAWTPPGLIGIDDATVATAVLLLLNFITCTDALAGDTVAVTDVPDPAVICGFATVTNPRSDITQVAAPREITRPDVKAKPEMSRDLLKFLLSI
jgi:hypothetical protein